MIFRALFFEHDAEIRQKGHLWTGTSTNVTFKISQIYSIWYILMVTKGGYHVTKISNYPDRAGAQES
jgi:hypothetical protein